MNLKMVAFIKDSGKMDLDMVKENKFGWMVQCMMGIGNKMSLVVEED